MVPGPIAPTCDGIHTAGQMEAEKKNSILPGGIEDGRRDPNILILRLDLNWRFARANQWRGDTIHSNSSLANQRRSAATLDWGCHPLFGASGSAF